MGWFGLVLYSFWFIVGQVYNLSANIFTGFLTYQQTHLIGWKPILLKQIQNKTKTG